MQAGKGMCVRDNKESSDLIYMHILTIDGIDVALLADVTCESMERAAPFFDNCMPKCLISTAVE